jgi:RNA 3'-terminal phosphate cyclase
MGDQILPFLAIAGSQSTLSTTRVTDHLRTNLWVINHFLPIETQIKEEKTRAVVALRCLHREKAAEQQRRRS